MVLARGVVFLALIDRLELDVDVVDTDANGLEFGLGLGAHAHGLEGAAAHGVEGRVGLGHVPRGLVVVLLFARKGRLLVRNLRAQRLGTGFGLGECGRDSRGPDVELVAFPERLAVLFLGELDLLTQQRKKTLITSRSVTLETKTRRRE